MDEASGSQLVDRNPKVGHETILRGLQVCVCEKNKQTNKPKKLKGDKAKHSFLSLHSYNALLF